ncbi:MAG: type III pantothenate kinase [Candidatus Omnitrophica bacterium]|nr:type III pantothenate kinase [Candidatus Omnitrophota bacterium]
MLLTVDIGNTNINFGIFKGLRLVKKFFIPTKDYSIRRIKSELRKYSIKESIIASVVPKACNILEKDLKSLFTRRPCVLGKNTKVPIINFYRNPSKVGQDRLVNAYAGVMLYGAPLILIDFGTAITIDVVSKKKEYLGGLIIPGLGISLTALAKHTALLPRIKLSDPKELIGSDTKNSILSGIVYGFSALADNLAERIKDKIGMGAKIVATGGDIGLIAKYSKCIDKVDRDLTLKGLNIIFRAAKGEG